MSVFLHRFNERKLEFPPIGTQGYKKLQKEQLLTAVNEYLCPGLNPLTSFSEIVSTFKQSLHNCKTNLESVDNLLLKENEIMFTYVYHAARHRNEKFYTLLKKLSKCIRRYEEIELSKHIDRILTILQDTDSTKDVCYLPTIIWVDYLLSQWKATFQLCMKTASYAFEAAILLRSKVAIGHFAVTAVIFFSSVSRIRTICIYLSNQMAKYHDIFATFYTAMRKVKNGDAFIVPFLSDEIQREKRTNCLCERNKRDMQSKNMEEPTKELFSYFQDSSITDDTVEPVSADIPDCDLSVNNDLGECMEPLLKKPKTENIADNSPCFRKKKKKKRNRKKSK